MNDVVTVSTTPQLTSLLSTTSSVSTTTTPNAESVHLPSSSSSRVSSSLLSTVDIIAGFVTFHILIGIPVTIILLIGIVGLYWYPTSTIIGIIIPYYTYIIVINPCEKKFGAHNIKFSKSFPLFRILQKYFNLKIVSDYNYNTNKTTSTENDDNKQQQQEAESTTTKQRQQYIFAIFPHGCYSDYRIIMDGMLSSTITDVVACNTRTLAASVLFRIPLIREISLWTGCVDASRSVAEYQLQHGKSLVILPGGEAEQIRTIYQKERIYIQQRKGFIRLALQYQIPVVPVYVFGVNDYYQTSIWLFSLRLWLVKNFGICIPFTYGQYGSPLCPYPIPTTIVMGKPLILHTTTTTKNNKTDSTNSKSSLLPTTEEINIAHERFIKAITDLFNQHKHQYGYGDRELEIM